MKHIKIEVDACFDAELTALARSLRTSKSQLIRLAVESYLKQLEREALAEQIKQASLKVRVQAAATRLQLRQANGDGL